MKRLFYLFVLLPAFAVGQSYPVMIASGGGAAAAPLSPSAELWFQFENNSADSSGNARDATYSGSYTTSSAPQGTYWLTANGSADVNPIDFTHNDTITMFCRFRYDAASNGIMARYGYYSNSEGWTWQLDGASNAMDFNKKISSTIYYSRTANSIMSQNTTYSAAVVVEGPTSTFYLDGSATSSPDNTTTAAYPVPGDSIEITDNWWGEFDDFQFYNYAVDSDSILYLHNNPGYVLKDVN